MKLKNTQFQMLPENTIVNCITPNFCKLLDLPLVNFKNKIFMGVDMPSFREGQVEKIGLKLEKYSIVQGIEGFFICS